MKKSMIMVLGAVALAGAAQASEINYKNGGWLWDAGSWEGGEKPGPDDTAVIPELPMFKARILDNRLQSIALTENEEIEKLLFKNLYAGVIQGNAQLTLHDLIAESVYPTAEDIVLVASNRLAMTQGIKVKGDASTFDIGANQRFEVSVGMQPVKETLVLTKTGAGTLLLSSGNEIKANEIRVEEGVVERTGASYPALKTSRLVIGGAGKQAVVEFGANTHGTKVASGTDIIVREGGTLKIDASGSGYYEDFEIDHGTVDAPGYVFIMSNDKNTERDITYILTGATIIGDIQWPWAAPFTIAPADKPSVIVGKMNILGNLFDVPDGEAAVDFVIDGKIGGGNRNYGKNGAGTMLFIDRDPSDLYGIGRDFVVNAGTFILQSETEIGLGTNNVVVAAGATFGGVGHQVGGLDPANEIRGVRGHITLNGAAGNPATLSVGTVDYKTGAYVPGTFTVGSAEQENNVTFNNECVLKIGTTPTGVSKLVVNGTFALSGNDTLDIVGPTSLGELTPGTYEIVKTSTPMTASFKTITYNGGELPKALKVKTTDSLITLKVPPRGFAIIVR